MPANVVCITVDR